ncbi:MAG TPA: LacI family transcriptional regulator [Clostridiales bacterium]|nr:LacI family transcriptional regulator [Clostridiales bacterium]
MKKVLALALCLMMVGTLASGCGKETTENKGNADNIGITEAPTQEGEVTPDVTEGAKKVEIDTSKTIKIGVLVSDATTPEALAFRSYYTDYIQKQYNVEFVYSDELKDAAGEKSAIDTLVTNNCKAIISFSSFDRPAQIEQCAGAKVYYAVATGTLTQEQYDKYKDNEYYVGAIGPSLEDEYQTGYDMAKRYIDLGNTNYAIFGGAIPYFTDMHIYRAAGMLTAMVEAGGADANYLGATTKEAIVQQIYADSGIQTGNIGSLSIVAYVGGYDMNDAWFAQCAQMAQTKDLQVILAVGNGSDFFGAAIKGADVKIASVDAYASSYGDAMNAGMLDYLAGKFSASIGPVFAAVYSTVNGYPIRTDEGYALALSQGYWIAASSDEFQKYYAVDSSKESPAYTKSALDILVGSDYKTFSDFVSKYSFDEVVQLSK